MAECYQKMGNAEARKIFEQVVREYGDQKEAAAEATARLGNVAAAVSARGDHAVWTGPKVDLFGRVSPDGRYISYTDWIEAGNLMVHDTATGSDRALTPNKSWADGPYAEFSAISRDGKQVAYAWFDAKNECELRVAPLDGSGVPSSRLLYRNPGEVDDIAPYDWSADGRWIAVHLRMKDFSGRIALVSAADGALRVLKSTDWKGPSKIFFSPDSRYIAYDLPVSDTKENTDVFVMALEGSRETPVVVHPAEDVVMGWSPEGGYLLFASDRTGRMCLWGLPVADGKARGPAEMLKPDTGEPWSLGVTDAGAMYVFKLVGGFEVQVAGIDLARGRVSGPQPNLGLTKLDARPANWSRDGKYLSYVWCKTGSGNCKLFIRSMETGELRQVRPKLQYFIDPAWSPDSKSLITGGRDLKGRWGVFRFDSTTGETSMIVQLAMAGSHPQWSPDGKKIYYHDTTGYLERDLDTGNTREVIRRPSFRNPFNVSPDGQYLVTTETDLRTKKSNLMLVPVSGGEIRTLLSVDEPDQLLVTTAWTPDGQAVFAGTKTGGHVGVWLVPTVGGPARKLDITTDQWAAAGGLAGFRVSPDAHQITWVSGKKQDEIWALENFLPARKTAKARN